MSQATSISWADASWNPVRGCTRVSAGCVHCYAERMAARNMPGHRSPTTGKPFAVHGSHGPHWTGAVELIQAALDWPLRVRRPAWVRKAEAEGRKPRIFVNSMSDLFHERLPVEDIFRVLRVIRQCYQFEFVVLTKRPEVAQRELAYFQSWPTGCNCLCHDVDGDTNIEGGCEHCYEIHAWPIQNLTLGVSVENQTTADERIPVLLRISAARRIVSYEPALGPVDFDEYLSGQPRQVSSRQLVTRDMAIDAGDLSMEGSVYSDDEWEQTAPRLDGIIFGGESGPNARPCDITWARSTRDQCKSAGVAFWCKQLGARPVNDHTLHPSHSLYVPLPLYDRAGADPAEWPEDLRVQEWPK